MQKYKLIQQKQQHLYQVLYFNDTYPNNFHADHDLIKCDFELCLM